MNREHKAEVSDIEKFQLPASVSIEKFSVMVRLTFVFILFTTFLHFGSPFGDSIVHFLNIRCALADKKGFKHAFKLYDEIISSSIVSFHHHAPNDEPEKIEWVNDTYVIKGFDREKPTRVVIHGFWNSHNSRINKALKAAYLQNYDVNLIIVNYSRISRDVCYKIARSRVDMLGKKIAKFLDVVLGEDEWQWRNLILVGHSLGAHTAGGNLKNENIELHHYLI
jgi:hypothetical protein